MTNYAQQEKATITFSSRKVNRRNAGDEPGPEPFYIVYADGDDIGEAYYKEDENAVDAYVTRSAAMYARAIQNAIQKHFGTEYVEVNYVD